MKCPNCKKYIHSVIVLSYCTQTATLKPRTNVIDTYETDMEAGGTVSIHCPLCDKIITGAVKEM